MVPGVETARIAGPAAVEPAQVPESAWELEASRLPEAQAGVRAAALAAALWAQRGGMV